MGAVRRNMINLVFNYGAIVRTNVIYFFDMGLGTTGTTSSGIYRAIGIFPIVFQYNS
jgi:hypothetical protein